jgi:hypothetical protein
LTSTFTWLDYSERDRRRALDVIDLFRESGTVDELGVGTIRDAFSDLLFPGTSTIQTRACYFLLLPWTYLRLERLRTRSARVAESARWEELRLNEVLLKGPDTDGVFGSTKGKALKRLPSAAYWGGLASWGILLFPGFQHGYFQSLDSFYKKLQTPDPQAADPESRSAPPTNWHPHVPPAPKGFPDVASVALRHEDAEYLRDRILSRHSGTLLAELVSGPRTALAVDQPWDVEGSMAIPPKLREVLHHARLFSTTMNGAALLYNLMLAEKRRHADWIDRYRERLGDWAIQMEALGAEFAHWKQDEIGKLWEVVKRSARRPHPAAEYFVSQWLDLLPPKHGFQHVADSVPARRLIQARELRLKGGRARLYSQRHLELWGGASGTSPMNYRWSDARVILRDIHDGLARPAGA